MRVSKNDPAAGIRLGFLLCCLFLLSACTARDPIVTGSETRAGAKPTFADQTVSVLEQASSEFEAARVVDDAPAMARAALKRLDIFRPFLSESVETQLLVKTGEMIRQARVVAADNKEMQGEIEKLISEANLGPTSKTGNLSGKFGKFGSGLESKQLITYLLVAENNRLIRMRVSADNGFVVYVEAPARSGVALHVVDESETPVCSDTSQHGILICRWRPANDGVVNVIIENASPFEVAVLVITNGPVGPGD